MRLPDKRLNELLALGVGRVGPNDITAYDLIALVEEAIASRDRLERAEKALRCIGEGDIPVVRAANDECPHGMFFYEVCQSCIGEYALAALARDQEKPNADPS